jgi:hypothetical protein
MIKDVHINNLNHLLTVMEFGDHSSDWLRANPRGNFGHGAKGAVSAVNDRLGISVASDTA